MPLRSFGAVLVPKDRVAAWQRRYPNSFDPGAAQLMFAIRALAQRINDNANEWLAPFGLTAKRFNYLATLCSDEGVGMTLIELGNFVHTSSGTVTTMVNALEREGLVKRTANPDDARSFRIRPTKKAYSILEKAWAFHHQRIDEIVGTLTAHEKSTLLELLVRLGARLDELGTEERVAGSETADTFK